ncbi:MAG TPA: hypothetical protein VHG32_20655 [Thermoanaerobaculia bacterium]|jgi:hypothetical protein|nr:hypothetical protein [Thermoanaerobaculia bacterium]
MRTRFLSSMLAAGALLAVVALAGSAARATSPVPPAGAGFDHLKALTGSWQAKMPDGKVTHVSYEVDAAGTAVVEKLQSEGEPPMVTVYYPDGSQVMLTHYCTLGNHPRMRTSGAAAGDSLSFAFVDATNMKGQNDAHMHGLKLTFADADHFSQTWVMKKDGKEIPLTFNFERSK